MQELDARCARQLARFRHWAEMKFNVKCAALLWKALDRRGKWSLPQATFQRELRRLQPPFTEPELEEIGHWLDWQEKGVGVPGGLKERERERQCLRHCLRHF